MPSDDRSQGRDVHIYDAKDLETLLGGLELNAGVTKSNFYSMVDILLFSEAPLSIEDETFAILQRSKEPLRPGNYYVTGDYKVSNEPVLTCAVIQRNAAILPAFEAEVRARDGRCVVTGMRAVRARFDDWIGFEATYIFPLAHEQYWREHDFGRWITVPSANGDTIHSKQNGLLLTTPMQQLFETYHFSIDPDDNHKVISFMEVGSAIGGKHLDKQFLDDPGRPPDELLRWHFRQAVLTNMKGLGEPLFESDFPPGSDIMGEILEGPKAAERMEYELLNRLALHKISQQEGFPKRSLLQESTNSDTCTAMKLVPAA